MTPSAVLKICCHRATSQINSTSIYVCFPLPPSVFYHKNGAIQDGLFGRAPSRSSSHISTNISAVMICDPHVSTMFRITSRTFHNYGWHYITSGFFTFHPLEMGHFQSFPCWLSLTFFLPPLHELLPVFHIIVFAHLCIFCPNCLPPVSLHLLLCHHQIPGHLQTPLLISAIAIYVNVETRAEPSTKQYHFVPIILFIEIKSMHALLSHQRLFKYASSSFTPQETLRFSRIYFLSQWQ